MTSRRRVDHPILRAVLTLVAAGGLALPATSVAVGTRADAGTIAASDHTCAITAGGGVKCWGDNSAGGLGDGTMTATATPVDVAGLASGVDAIAAGDRYSCALTKGGGVKCWGYNEFGQLGNGTTTDSALPVDVVGLTSGVDAIAARGEHTCALITARVKCWGANLNGQLGDGTTTSSNLPVDVTGLSSGIIAIATGGEHTCAIASGGSVKCWGWNSVGQLGIGTTSDRSTPVDVVGLAGDVKAVATGGRHTCALMTAGGVKCWGYDEFGQLGNGSTANSPIPVDVAGLTGNVSAITTGGNITCALRAETGVACWGIDLTGQLAGGATFDRAGPVAVAGLTRGVTSIVAGYYHVCATTRDGEVMCWGGNDTGQLGNGTTADSPTPIAVRNADGTALVAASADALRPSSLLPIAIAGVVGVVLVLALGWYGMRRRRRQ
jgi:alpha-tubulin suppressor-like RCC1 family protein